MFEQTSVLLTIQGPWIDLSPSFLLGLPGSSFLKCRIAWISCTPCQTTKPACPNKSTLLWLYSPGMSIHMLLPLRLGAQACLRNWMAASFSANTIAHIPGNKEKDRLTVRCSGFCVDLLPEDSRNFLLDIETLKVLQMLHNSLCLSWKHNPNREKCVCFLLVWIYRGPIHWLWSSLLCDLEERQHVVLKEHRLRFWKPCC